MHSPQIWNMDDYTAGRRIINPPDRTGMVEFRTMKAQKIISSDEWANLILGLSLLFGLIVRLFPGLMAGFPINDGGMFLTMIRELRANDFTLPAFTAYNYSEIPFAYPPFGLYIGVLLNTLGLSEMNILRWLPVTVNFLSIPAFYLLAAALLDDRPRSAVATVFFALTPGSYSWQIMGGGLTRSFGMAFLILALWSVYRMFKRGESKWILLSVLFCSFAVFSHPEVSLATATSCTLFWLFFGRSRRRTLHAVLVALGTMLVTSVWWGTVLAQHGWAPFLSVIHSGAYISSPFRALYLDFLAPASLLSLSGILRLAGVTWSWWRRQFFLPAWLIMPYFAEPRSAPAMSFLASCILIGIGLTEALPFLLDRIRTRNPSAISSLDFTQRQWLGLTVLGAAFFLFVGSALYDFRLINTSLVPPAPQQAMDWVRENTPPQSRFLILTASPGIMTDPIQEWFPALGERRSLTTLQGLEWTLGSAFFPRLEDLVELQACQNVPCVESWAAATGLGYSHVLIHKNESAQTVLEAFIGAETYRPVYENPEVEIFEK